MLRTHTESMSLQWRASEPAVEGDDAGFSLHSASADEAVVTKEGALHDFWDRMLSAVFPAYASTAWDGVNIELWLAAGRVFAYPMHSGAGERPVGPACVLDLANLQRLITALNADGTVPKEDYRVRRSQIAEEYTQAIVTGAKRILGCEAVSGRWLLYDGTPRRLVIELT